MHDRFVKRMLIPVLAICGAGIMGATAAWPQAQIPKEPVKWSIKVTSPDKPLKIGDELTLQLKATIEPGWHLYGIEQEPDGPIPTRVSLAPDQPFEQVGSIDFSEPAMTLDPNFGKMVHFYQDEATFTIKLKVGISAPPGKIDVRVNASFQSCNDGLCLPLKTVKLTAAVNIASH